MYHGTAIERGREMIRKKRMEYSRGDDQWLGEGIYLYRDKLYAFRWITLKYKERFDLSIISDKLFKEYMILDVKIDYEYDNVFSFSNPDHIILFERVKEHCKNKKWYIEKLKKYEFTDGVVLNFMFKKMNFGNDYDMVEAHFPLVKSQKDEDTRIQLMGEYQLCIKNPNKIISLCDCSEQFNYSDYNDRLTKFNKYRTSRNYAVKTKVRGEYYG